MYVLSAGSHSWFRLFDMSWIHILLCPLVCQPLRLSGGLTFSCLFWLQLGLGMLFGSAGFVSGHVSQACNTSLVFGFPAWPFVVGCCMGSPIVELVVGSLESWHDSVLVSSLGDVSGLSYVPLRGFLAVLRVISCSTPFLDSFPIWFPSAFFGSLPPSLSLFYFLVLLGLTSCGP